MGYLFYCVIGPIQPYLAKKLDVEIDTVNLVWTFGFVGFIIGSLAAGFVFRRFCKDKRSKMWFMASTFSINGLIMIGIPFINDFKGSLISEGIFILKWLFRIGGAFNSAKNGGGQGCQLRPASLTIKKLRIVITHIFGGKREQSENTSEN